MCIPVELEFLTLEWEHNYLSILRYLCKDVHNNIFVNFHSKFIHIIQTQKQIKNWVCKIGKKLTFQVETNLIECNHKFQID